MTRRYLLEISVGTVERAVAAERGGADRIELCADLPAGGLTPSPELLRGVREKVHIPIYSMIRPRAGNFVYSESEFAEMERSIAVASGCGVDGVVLGILKKNHRIDVPRTRRLIDLAQPLPVTFHRAFDECPDLRVALEELTRSGAARILTSGGAKTALEGAEALAKLISASAGRVIFVPGAGISACNIAEVAERTGAREFHSGLSAELPYSSRDVAKFQEGIRKLTEQLARLG